MISYAGRTALRTLFLLVCVLVLAPVSSKDASGYVVPPEQLLKFMAENVVGFETLGIAWEQSTGEEETGEAPVLVEVWFRSYDDYSARHREGPAWEGRTGPGAGFLELFCGKRHRTERFLAGKGVDLDTSAYTRLDTTVAYRIGRDMPDDPVILLEKSRFIPLLLRFEPEHGRGREILEIRFQDYRRVGDGWFPHEILYRAASGVTGSYTVLDVRPNEPGPPRVPSVERSKGGEAVTGGESERLERVIRAFEERYGDR
ncbi:MAG: hypothetical protein ACQET7_01910 [Thermodesulfobacteriota bacterium]